MKKTKSFAYVRIPKTGSHTLAYYLHDRPNYYTYGLYHYPYVVLESFVPECNWITFARDPFQLYCSFYFFMQYRIHTQKALTNPLSYTHHNDKNIELITNNVSIEEFLAECPKGQFLPYFWLPMQPNDFDFVGITDDMDRSLHVFNKMFDLNVKNTVINNNPSKKVNEKYVLAKGIENKFRKDNAQEFELYALAKEKFDNLYNTWTQLG